jgi:hypothetical protein
MANVKVQFTAAGGFDRYHDVPEDLTDGMIKEVTEEEAYRLVTQFPANFSVVKEKAITPPYAKIVTPGKSK